MSFSTVRPCSTKNCSNEAHRSVRSSVAGSPLRNTAGGTEAFQLQYCIDCYRKQAFETSNAQSKIAAISLEELHQIHPEEIEVLDGKPQRHQCGMQLSHNDLPTPMFMASGHVQKPSGAGVGQFAHPSLTQGQGVCPVNLRESYRRWRSHCYERWVSALPSFELEALREKNKQFQTLTPHQSEDTSDEEKQKILPQHVQIPDSEKIDSETRDMMQSLFLHGLYRHEEPYHDVTIFEDHLPIKSRTGEKHQSRLSIEQLTRMKKDKEGCMQLRVFLQVLNADRRKHCSIESNPK